MQKQKINEIQKLAHSIDTRINLFEGYSPKKTDSYTGELLFWRQVVNIYGIFVDCDRFQIKEKTNLVELMCRYSLIDKNDYNTVLKFWEDVSELRKWFCHNNDISLHYANMRQKKIKNYLNIVFLCASNKPEQIEDIQPKDWNMLTYDLERRFQNYLDILKKGFEAWKQSTDLEDLIAEWIVILAKALYGDKELIQNILVDIAVYERKNCSINNMSVSQLANSYYRNLELRGFSEKNIENELKKNLITSRTNKDIVLDSIRNSQLI